MVDICVDKADTSFSVIHTVCEALFSPIQAQTGGGAWHSQECPFWPLKLPGTHMNAVSTGWILNTHIWTRWCDVDVIYDVWDRLRSRTIAPWPSTNTTQHIAYYRQYCILHITGFNRNWSSRNRNYKLWSRWIITTRCRTNFLLFDFVPIVLHHNLLNWV